jgi:flavin reductase (DIM6/NTAB) family NADH-FMN oxidoreductase RutF
MNALFQRYITSGVYVVAVSNGECRHAFTAAWVMPVSFEPPLLAISINPDHYSYALLKVGGVCTVNVLGKHQFAIAEHFGRTHAGDKMAGFNWQTGKTTAPVLNDSLAYFDCKVSHYADAGDHQLVICEVLDAVELNRGEPLRYQQTGNMDGMSDAAD